MSEEIAAPRGQAYEKRVANELGHYREAFRSNDSGAELKRCLPTISAFQYSMELFRPFLVARMPSLAIDPHVLDVISGSERRVRILSLGCATGDWELAIARQQPGRCEISLVDLNPELLAQAAAYGETHGIDVRIFAGDVNKYDITPDYYDFIVCRASLHHFLMLERVLEQIRRGLAPAGEFMAIGEWIGRNGLRIYPETEVVANELFRQLPPRLRKNAYTGHVDDTLPNIDHSVNSFEAIRSEDIMPLLLETFEPVEYVAYDALVTLFFDFRYGPNYSLDDPHDRAVVERITALDVGSLERGTLRPTALFGRFRRE